MKITPKTEQEINEANLIPDKTVCDFEVVKALDTTSKKTGAEMIALTIKVYYNEGFKLVNDYLMEAMAAKLRHFCEAGDLMKQYADGSLKAEDCVGVCGKIKVKLVPAGEFPAKNDVRDYVVPEREKVLAATVKPAAPQAPAAPAADDDVPF